MHLQKYENRASFALQQLEAEVCNRSTIPTPVQQKQAYTTLYKALERATILSGNMKIHWVGLYPHNLKRMLISSHHTPLPSLFVQVRNQCNEYLNRGRQTFNDKNYGDAALEVRKGCELILNIDKSAIKLQSWYRMCKRRKAFKDAQRRRVKATIVIQR